MPIRYNMAMKPLIETNRYLRDPATREHMLRHSVVESSYFEGARGVKLPAPTRNAPRRKASAKKRVQRS
jgi:hypothetical protein